MSTEQASAHDSEDCVLGLCDHPVHQLEDAVIDLRDFLGPQAFSDPCDMLLPMFM